MDFFYVPASSSGQNTRSDHRQIRAAKKIAVIFNLKILHDIKMLKNVTLMLKIKQPSINCAYDIVSIVD